MSSSNRGERLVVYTGARHMSGAAPPAVAGRHFLHQHCVQLQDPWSGNIILNRFLISRLPSPSQMKK